VASWSRVAMSSTGQYQTAVINGGYIYISVQYGGDMVVHGDVSSWTSVAVSGSGVYQTAVINGGTTFYVSSNSGATWTSVTGSSGTSQPWVVAMSSSGQYQIAVPTSSNTVYPLLSTNYGTSWSSAISTGYSYLCCGGLQFRSVHDGDPNQLQNSSEFELRGQLDHSEFPHIHRCSSGDERVGSVPNCHDHE
jgi:hypothetical protein